MIHDQTPLSDEEPVLAEFRRYLAEPGPWSVRFRRLAEGIAIANEAEPIPLTSAEFKNMTILTCEQCQELLDVYVEDEQAGKNVRQTYPTVWRHLTTCLDCQVVYDLLSDMLAPEEAP